MMGYVYGDWGWGGWLSMTLMMVAFWGVLVALIVWPARADRGSRSERPAGQSGKPAEDVLAERFARGEIDAEEYRQRRDVLAGSGSRS
jgi:putative membrane protein